MGSVVCLHCWEPVCEAGSLSAQVEPVCLAGTLSTLVEFPVYWTPLVYTAGTQLTLKSVYTTGQWVHHWSHSKLFESVFRAGTGYLGGVPHVIQAECHPA